MDEAMEQLRPSYWKKIRNFFKDQKKSFIAPTTLSKSYFAYALVNTFLLYIEQVIDDKLKLTNWGTTDKNAHIT